MGSADFSGNVGVGTTSPARRLHVSNGSSGGTSQPSSELLVEDNSSCYVNLMAPDASEHGVSFGSPASSVHGGIYYTNSVGMDFRTGNNASRMTINPVGNVGIGVGVSGGSIDAKLHVSQAGRAAKFDRTGSDGEIVAFSRDDGVIGNITNSGGTVSYNPFTGSHFAWSSAAVPAGALVSMTGENHRFGDRPEAEVMYGVSATTREDDPACLGVSLGLMEPARDPGPNNPLLVAAVGNGELCVIDRGCGDLEPGDYLISSDIPGCAMKDDPSRFPMGHIIAKAGDRIRWADVPVGELGVRLAKASVLFGSSLRDSHGNAVQSELRELRAENTDLRKRVDSLERLIHQQQTRAWAPTAHNVRVAHALGITSTP